MVFLWSTSWVLIRFGLQEVPAVTFAGLRYAIAALCLLPFLFKRENRKAVRAIDRKQWGLLVALGIFLYAVAQSAQYLSLTYLSMATTSLLLNLTSLVVAGFGMVTLGEAPTRTQWLGIFLNLTGLVIFFYPPVFNNQEWPGIVIAIVGMLANSAGSLIGRNLNRVGTIPPLVLTAISMSIGAVLMLVSGIIFQGLPKISLASWGAILWMAIVNTALGFTLWNYTLRTLLAMESSIINSLMTVMIAILGWIFSNESLSRLEMTGVVLVTAGIILVQLRRLRRVNPQTGT